MAMMNFLCKRCAIAQEQLLEPLQGALKTFGGFQKTGFVMQGQNQAVNFKAHLGGVGFFGQMLLVSGLHHGTVNSGQPGFDGTGQGVSDGSWSIVKFSSAADVQTPRVDFCAGSLHPVMKQTAQAWQATRMLQSGFKHLDFKTMVVFPNDGDLQLFAGTKMREHARLAHLHDFSQCANAQTFQANLGGQAESRIDNGCFGLLAFVHAALPGRMAIGF
jgi:hypothetical protein